MAIQAAITGDVVNSTRLGKSAARRLEQGIQGLFPGNWFEFYRGDSFQACIRKPSEALRTALLCRTLALSLLPDAEEISTDIRLSIGIGDVVAPVRSLKTAKGEAFVLSGRAFDEMGKTGKRLAISTGTPLANEGLQVISGYLNSIFGSMTSKQARVIHGLLLGETQLAISHKIKKTKSTIHQHVVSARWSEIETLLIQYENIIKLIT